jgi:hypothetical protein
MTVNYTVTLLLKGALCLLLTGGTSVYVLLDLNPENSMPQRRLHLCPLIGVTLSYRTIFSPHFDSILVPVAVGKLNDFV